MSQDQREPDLAGWFQGAASVAARAQQGLADLIALAEKHWVPPSVHASLLDVLSAKREGQGGAGGGAPTPSPQTTEVSRSATGSGQGTTTGAVEGSGEGMQGFGSEEQLGICKDASAGAADSARDEEVANRAATDAAVAAAQQLGTPRTASGLRAKQQQEGDEANIGPGAVTEAESNTERLSQDRLAALTSSVADIGRAAAAFDLAGIVKGIKALGAVAEVEAAISAAATSATSREEAEADGVPRDASAFFMMYPAGQWYHIRRRRPPSQRSTDASGPSTDAQHMLRPASTTYSASTGSAALHAADAAAEDVTEIYGRYGGSSSRGKKASRAVAEDTGTAQEKAPSVEPGKAAPAAAQIKDKEAAPASALALAAMMADTAKAVGKRQGTGEQQRAVRPPYMVVRAAPDAPFFSRVRFTRAALRDHRCRTHRAGLLSALAQHSQKQSF